MSKPKPWFREDDKGRRIATRDCWVVTSQTYPRRGVVRVVSKPKTRGGQGSVTTFRASGPLGVLPPGTRFPVVEGQYIPKFVELCDSPEGEAVETAARLEKEATTGFASPPKKRKGGAKHDEAAGLKEAPTSTDADSAPEDAAE